MMLGGMRMPSVPAATIDPAAIDLSYPRVTIGASAMSVRIVTDAAMTPRQAARIVPKTIVTIASPPLSRPSAS